MSFNADKKSEHEKAAEKALADHDYAKAFFHTAKAADFTFNLAEQSSGALAKAYLQDANELVDVAVRLKEKAHNAKQDTKGKATAGGTEGGAPPDSHWLLQARPDLKLDDVAGLQKVKDQIRLRMILPFLHPEEAEKHNLKLGGGILMYGPPGTGKTYIARATAGELDAAFFAIKPSEIMSKWVGEAEQRVRELFEQARSCERAIVFIDEVEALVPARSGTNSTVMARVVPQFLAELEGVDTGSNTPLLFMGATNEPWLIDPAMMRPGRFDVKVYVGLPDAVARRQILDTKFNAGDTELVDGATLDMLVKNTDGYSGADLNALAVLAHQEGFLREISTDGFKGYDSALFQRCLAEVKPSVNQKTLKKFEKWANQK